jgi:hypothetical protein
MAGFKAREKVSGLEYDFTGITVADEDDQALLDQAVGVIAEPSTYAVRRMNGRQNDLLNLPADATLQQRLDALASKTEEEMHEMDAEQLDIISEITDGAPSRAELEALPFRHRQAFYGWLIGELANPSAGTTSSRRSVVPLKSATS